MRHRTAFVFLFLPGIFLLLSSLILIVLAQNIPLDNTYSNVLCGLSIDYPSSWIVRESNQKYLSGQSSLLVMTELRPNVPEGFKTVVELEAENITAYHRRVYGILPIRKRCKH